MALFLFLPEIPRVTFSPCSVANRSRRPPRSSRRAWRVCRDLQNPLTPCPRNPGGVSSQLAPSTRTLPQSQLGADLCAADSAMNHRAGSSGSPCGLLGIPGGSLYSPSDSLQCIKYHRVAAAMTHLNRSPLVFSPPRRAIATPLGLGGEFAWGISGTPLLEVNLVMGESLFGVSSIRRSGCVVDGAHQLSYAGKKSSNEFYFTSSTCRVERSKVWGPWAPDCGLRPWRHRIRWSTAASGGSLEEKGRWPLIRSGTT
jgi:hypothetical protein